MGGPWVLAEDRLRQQRGQEVPVDERPSVVDEKAAVCVSVPGDAEVRLLAEDLAHDELAILGQERVRLMVGKAAVGLPVGLDQVEPEAAQQRPDHRSCHPVAAVDDHAHRLDRAGLDESERGLLELLVELDVLDRAAARSVIEAGFDPRAHIADPRVTRQRDRTVPDELRAGVALGIVRGRAHQAAVELPRADEVIQHLGSDLAGVEHGRALGAHPLAVRARQLGRGQAHVPSQPEPERGRRLALELGDHACECPSDQLRDTGIDVGSV